MVSPCAQDGSPSYHSTETLGVTWRCLGPSVRGPPAASAPTSCCRSRADPCLQVSTNQAEPLDPMGRVLLQGPCSSSQMCSWARGCGCRMVPASLLLGSLWELLPPLPP